MPTRTDHSSSRQREATHERQSHNLFLIAEVNVLEGQSHLLIFQKGNG